MCPVQSVTYVSGRSPILLSGMAEVQLKAVVSPLVPFVKELSRQYASAIREYVIFRANQSLAEAGRQKKS